MLLSVGLRQHPTSGKRLAIGENSKQVLDQVQQRSWQDDCARVCEARRSSWDPWKIEAAYDSFDIDTETSEAVTEHNLQLLGALYGDQQWSRPQIDVHGFPTR